MLVGERLNNWGKLLVRAQKAFLYYLFFMLTSAMLLEILTRFFFNQSIFGLSDFIGYSSVWLYAVGASFATYERSHIKAEFINTMLRSDRARHICRFIVAVVSVGMSAIFTKWSFDLCLYSIEIQEKTQAYPVPKVIFQSSFFVGGLIMTLYFLWDAIDCYRAIKENRAFVASDHI